MVPFPVSTHTFSLCNCFMFVNHWQQKYVKCFNNKLLVPRDKTGSVPRYMSPATLRLTPWISSETSLSSLKTQNASFFCKRYNDSWAIKLPLVPVFLCPAGESWRNMLLCCSHQRRLTNFTGNSNTHTYTHAANQLLLWHLTFVGKWRKGKEQKGRRSLTLLNPKRRKNIKKNRFSVVPNIMKKKGNLLVSQMLIWDHK